MANSFFSCRSPLFEGVEQQYNATTNRQQRCRSPLFEGVEQPYGGYTDRAIVVEAPYLKGYNN